MAEGASPVSMLGVLLRAWAAALAGLPTMLRRRRAVQALRRVSTRDFAALLHAHRLGLRALAFTD
jgi:hypothetical protein